MYKVTHQVSDYILLTLICKFRCLPYSAWAAANVAEMAWHVGNMVELPNQRKQNVVADLMGHPVVPQQVMPSLEHKMY